MNTHLKENIQQLTLLARVAYAIACAERALHILRDWPQAHDLATRAVEKVWQWENGNKVSASELHDLLHQLLDTYPIVKSDPKAERASLAIASAMYYTSWEVDRFEARVQGEKWREPLPNDLADVSEEDLEQALTYAAEVVDDRVAEARWQKRVLVELVARFKTANPDEPGATVPREFFSRASNYAANASN